ncbi:hypothetical protein [Sphingobium yanoikuyae]|uniref:hypothetical protein n=1 Tax=Sphingobium yanoikuyae TaxID=13690 RepID=UPI0022DE292B|nr:hypothetical protein [Sphingobium yanoikuyae]WBQ19338.1 hypothetical protein PAE53_23410 [Sphingobium yanoikuyae]
MMKLIFAGVLPYHQSGEASCTAHMIPSEADRGFIPDMRDPLPRMWKNYCVGHDGKSSNMLIGKMFGCLDRDPSSIQNFFASREGQEI